METVEKKGKSVDEAIKSALEELQCEIDDVVIEVLEEPNKGLLGMFGKKSAIVKVTRNKKTPETAENILINLLDRMGVDYKIDKVEEGKGRVRINIVGEDMGLVIGRKGETLNSLQFMVGLILNHDKDERTKVILDVEDYRKKQEESLEELALRLSGRVKATRKNIVMRPMSSQERRIVHSVLQDDPNIATYSTGDEPNRKIVISLKNKNEK